METYEFRHDAMNTELTLKIRSDDIAQARSAAYEAFDTVDYLENLLSLYRDGSDISCVNAMDEGAIFTLTEDAANCLMCAFKANELSLGALDVCMGEFFLKAKSDTKIPVHNPPCRGIFEFDPENFLIRKKSAGYIDLGSLGKGFAVDAIASLFRDTWEIKNAFINFGASSIGAIGSESEKSEGWNVNFGEKEIGNFSLKNNFMGASGTAILGEHILDGRTGELTKNPKFRSWAIADSGAMADAMSTAFMILSSAEISEVCKKNNFCAAIQKEPDSILEKFGF